MGGQYFKTKIENLAKRHFIFYFRYPPDANSGSYYNYELYIDDVRVFHRTDKFVFSMISTKKEIDAKIILPTGRLISNLTYMSVPYSNITDDILICNDDSENIKSFLIKKPKTDFTYIWYSLSSDKIHFYKDNAYTSTLKESFKAVWNEYEYFVLMKDKGCFQIKYLNIYQSIIIYKKDTLIISTTSIYNLIYEDTAQTFFNITLYSKENNFIEKIRIQNYGPTLDIKKDRNNLYYYEFAYSSNYEGRIYFDIYFNLTQKDYILVEFDIRNNLTPEKLIINIKEEQNKNIKDIGNNGTLEIITDYNDTETYIFSNSDIESYTFNNTMIDKDNNYTYNVICRLWKCNKGRIKIFCKFYEDLKYETKNLIFSNTTYSYRKYTFNIINYCFISINKINGNIPFIYSEDQIIDIDSGYILYFKFKYDSYSKEKLFLFDNKFKSAYFEKCTTKPIKREIDCQISNEKLKSILSFSGENFFLANFNKIKGLYSLETTGDIIITYNTTKKDQYVLITNIINKFAEKNSFIYYETNITNISELTSSFFDIKFNNTENSCMFKKRVVNYENLLLICYMNQTGKTDFNRIENKILNDINIENNFIVLEGNNDQIISDDQNGGNIITIYPEIMKFKNKNFISMKIGVEGNIKGIKLNKNSENELECIKYINYLDCKVPRSHFDNNETKYYNIYYENYLNQNSIKYEAPLILVTFSEEYDEEEEGEEEKEKEREEKEKEKEKEEEKEREEKEKEKEKEREEKE